MSDELRPSAPDADELAIARALDLLPDGVDPDALDDSLVSEYLEVLASLPLGEIEPPAHLEARVMAAARAARPPVATSLDGARTRREMKATTSATPLRRRLAVVSAAAAVFAMVALGAALVANRADENHDQQLAAAENLQDLQEARRNPGSDDFDLSDSSGRSLGKAVIDPDGHGFVYDVTLPGAADGETYWLWLSTPAGSKRVGKLGNDLTSKVVVFNVLSGEYDDVFITSETSDSPTTPSQPPVASSR